MLWDIINVKDEIQQPKILGKIDLGGKKPEAPKQEAPKQEKPKREPKKETKEPKAQKETKIE